MNLNDLLQEHIRKEITNKLVEDAQTHLRSSIEEMLKDLSVVYQDRVYNELCMREELRVLFKLKEKE